MIVLKKNRILVVACSIIIALFAFSFKIGRNAITVETVSLPVSNKVIILDAGHRSTRRRCPKF